MSLKIKSKFRGRSPYRYADNPLERRFAEVWQEYNDRGNSGATLEYLLDPGPYGSKYSVSTRDWEVANTVVQWLGSPVGQAFLQKVLQSPEAQAFREQRLRALF